MKGVDLYSRDGTSSCGGVLYVGAGKLNVYGVHISGTDAVVRIGGAVYVGGGEVNLTGTEGDPIVVDGGTVVMEVDSASTGKALNFYGSGSVFGVAGGKLILNYCKANGYQTKSLKDGSLVDYGNLTKDTHGGSVLFVKGGSAEVYNSEFVGYIGAIVNKRGGTIYARGGSVLLNNTSVSASWSTINGPAIQVDSPANVTIQEGCYIDSSNLATVIPGGLNYGACVTVAGGVLNIEGGTISGYKSKTTGGGSLSQSNGTINMSGGLITGGSFTLTGSDTVGGGNVYVSGGVFNMSGGEISGGNSSGSGGNVYFKHNDSKVTTAFNMTGGTIKDGTATRYGGNLYLYNGSFNMGTSGDASVTSPAFSGGTNTTSSFNGGSIYVNSGTFKMMSGVVSGGQAANVGSNIYVALNGTLEMTGGKFCDPAKNGSNQNVFVVNGLLKMSGGEIVGMCTVTKTNDSAKDLQLSGTAKITGTGSYAGLYLSYTVNKVHASRIQVVAPFEEGACIVLNEVKASEHAPSVAIANTEENIQANKELFESGILVPASGKVLRWEDAGIGVNKESEVWHCYCGHNSKSHDLGCNGFDVKWIAWDGKSNIRAAQLGKPTDFTGIHYSYRYLSADAVGDNAPSGQLLLGGTSGSTTNPVTAIAYHLVIDFNGHTIDSDHRAFQVQSDTSFTICNSSTTEGTLRGAGTAAASATDTANRNIGVIMLRSTTTIGGTFDMLDRVTVEFKNIHNRITTDAGIACSVNGNMYGGTIKGDLSTTTGTTGGALTIKGGANFVIHPNAEIYGGACQKGAAVYVDGVATVVTMLGGKITGGQATVSGGAVYLANGTFNQLGGKITGGQATVSGGNVYVAAGKYNMDGSSTKITEGICRAVDTNSETAQFAYGGNVYIAVGVFNMTNGAEITKGVVCSEYADSWAPGGNIYINAGVLNITNATVKDGFNTEEGLTRTGVDGNNIYINYNATVNLETGAHIINNTNNAQENITIQGGSLNLKPGCLVETIDGIVGSNIRANNSALTNKKDDVYHFNNVDKAPVINMTGGTVSGGSISGKGGNVFLSHLAVFNMEGGVIRDGYAKNAGGNIYVDAKPAQAIVKAYNEKFPNATKTAEEFAGQVHISGDAQIIGGECDGDGVNGGSIFMGAGTQLTVSDNVKIYGGKTAWLGGNIYSNGYVTIGGNAQIYGGTAVNTESAVNIFMVNGDLTISESPKIAGGISVTRSDTETVAVRTVNISGSPLIDKDWLPENCEAAKPKTSLLLSAGSMLNVGELTDATVYVSCGTLGAQTLRVFTNAAADLAGAEAWLPQFHCDMEGYVIGITDDHELFMGNGPKGATVNGGEIYYELGAAAEKAVEGDLITLHSGYDQALTLKANTWLDLNGQTLTGDITASGLRLLDSANKAYTDAGGRITGSISEAPVRAFTTGALKTAGLYDGNHRYLVLKTEDGYSAHRIYLTVKSTVLYPNKPALNYRTVFKCDDTVAEYVTAYGVKIAAEDYDPVHSNYLEKGIELNTVEDNSYISQLNNILTPDMSLENQILYTETPLATCAYITIADSFGSGNEVFSATVTKSFKDMMEYADGLTLSAVQQASLKDLYTKYEALMTREGEAWNLTNIAGFQSSEARGFQLRCMCNDPTSTGNPCAANGHKHFVWQPWSDFDAAAPVSGNYYLTADVAQPLEIPNGMMVSIDLCGYSLTANAITVEKGGVLNLTNSADTGVTVAAVVTVNGNMSVYSGVNLSRAVVGSGDMNLYGGTATMAEDFTGKWYPTDEE